MVYNSINMIINNTNNIIMVYMIINNKNKNKNKNNININVVNSINNKDKNNNYKLLKLCYI
jgi:hypothetical protein